MIVVPAPLPDELVNGYRGRVLRLNGWLPTKQNARCLLGQYVGHKTSFHDLPMGQLLAHMTQMSLERFVSNHSMYPLQRAVAKDVTGGLMGVGPYRKAAEMQLFRVPRPRAYLCQSCIKEDLDFHGVSYWRREHQIPGYFSCGKHGDPLWSIGNFQRHAFEQSPASAMQDAIPTKRELVDSQNSSPANIRYLEICSHLLVCQWVLSKTAVSQLALGRALELGLEVDEQNILKSLYRSGEVRSFFNAQWLELAIAETVKCSLPRPVESMGGVWNATFAAALIFGALHPTGDDAINAMSCTTETEATCDNASGSHSSDGYT